MAWTDDLKGLVGQATDASGTLATGVDAVKVNYDKVANVFAGTIVPANTAATPGAKDAQRDAVNITDNLADGVPVYKRAWFWVVVILVGVLVLIRRRR